MIRNLKKISNYDNIYMADSKEIEYSDGEVEIDIFKILSDLPNEKISRFDILDSSIKDWATEYHFSWVRQNILKPIKFGDEDIVLELGGGTGILTEFIAEKVNKIISIEGTAIRAKAISERCSYFENVEVIIADFLKLNLLEIFGKEVFDKITLIGVLEYIPKYSNENSNEAIMRVLAICKMLLKPKGELIIAIENKIGLKYILGWEEDHLGIPYYGAQSMYKSEDVETFSRKELMTILEEACFKNVQFYYPFPDYKLPSVIIKELKSPYTAIKKQLISSLLYNVESRNYSGTIIPKVIESRVRENFFNNDNLGDISNSFLIVAKQNGSITKTFDYTDPFAYYFSNLRKYRYSKEIHFFDNNKSYVLKRKWYGKKTEKKLINQAIEGSDQQTLIQGNIVHHLLENCFHLDEKQKYGIILKEWIRNLEAELKNYDYETFDLTPYNTIVDLNGDFQFIDVDEWSTKDKLKIIQILKRYSDRNISQFNWYFSKKMNSRELIDLIAEEFKLPKITNNQLDYLNRLSSFSNNKIIRTTNFNKMNQAIPNGKKKLKIKEFLPPIVWKFLKQQRKWLGGV